MLPKNLLAQPLQMHPLLLWQLQATIMQLPRIGTYLHHSHQLLQACRQTPKSFNARDTWPSTVLSFKERAERWPCLCTCSFLINELSQIKGEWVPIPLTPVPLLKKVQNLNLIACLSTMYIYSLPIVYFLTKAGEFWSRWEYMQTRCIKQMEYIQLHLWW